MRAKLCLVILFLMFYMSNQTACNSERALDLAVLHASSATDVVLISIRYGEADSMVQAPEIRQALGSGRFWIKLPPDGHGSVKVDVRAFNSIGCSLGVGTAQAVLQSPVTPLSVPLQDSGRPLCPVTVERSGHPSGTVVSNPSGIDCGPTCWLYTTSAVALTALVGRYAPFESMSGCDSQQGLTCIVSDVSRPRTVQVRFGNQCATGGACREPIPSSISGDLNAIAGRSDSDIWAVGDAGVALHWDGIRWASTTVDARCKFLALTVLDSGEVWAVGATNCVYYFDRSLWRNRDLPVMPGNRLVAVSIAGGKLCVGGERLFCGDEKDLAAPWNTVAISGSQVTGVVGLARDSRGGLFAVTAAGKAYSFTGVPTPTWKEDSGSPITTDPRGLFRLTTGPDDTLWTLGGSGFFRRQSAAWSELLCDVPGKLSGILLRGLGATGSHIWAVGGQGTLAACSLPQGPLRTYPTADPSLTLYGVYVPQSGDVYAVGERGLVLRLPKP